MTMLLNRLYKFHSLLLGGALITCSLFYLMQALINVEFDTPPPSITVDMTDIGIPDLIIDVIKETPKPPQPEDPPDMPPTVTTTIFDGNLPTGPYIPPKGPHVDPVIGGKDSFLVGDTSAIALVKVAPVYPGPALDRGIEGYVIVEFEVDEQGLVQNPRVLYAEPENIFDRAALKALERWRYQPKVVDGKAVRMRGVQQKLSFSLEN